MQEKGDPDQIYSQKKPYVPPHLRESTQDKSVGRTGDKTTPMGMSRLYTYDSIQNHFWPFGEDHIKGVGHGCGDVDQKKYSRESVKGRDEAPATKHVSNKKTLHDSAEQLGKLAYIILFSGNPRWDKDGLIFVKSNLDLLEPYRSKAETTAEDYVMVETEKSASTTTAHADHIRNDQSASSSKPDQDLNQGSASIPVFSYERKSLETELFRLTGHFRILRVDILEPNSVELERMMKQKWEPPWDKNRRATRNEKRWVESFSRRWAVVQLVPATDVEEDEDEDDEKKGAEQQEGHVKERLSRPGGSLNARLEKKLEPYDFKYPGVMRELRRMRLADDEAATAAVAVPATATTTNTTPQVVSCSER